MTFIDRIAISRSYNSVSPEGLLPGELHFSYLENSLYIGSPVDNSPPIKLLDGEFASKSYRDFSLTSVYYVSVDSVNSTDSMDNSGQSLARPFLSIERAILQGAIEAKKSYTVLILPGTYRVNNTTGANLDVIPANSPNTPLYLFNDPTTGSIVVPSGCSLVAFSPKDTLILPVYIPNGCGEGYEYVFNTFDGTFICNSSPGTPEGIESSIFSVGNNTLISGLSFRDSGYSIFETGSTPYNSPSHLLLFSIKGASTDELNNYYSKIRKAFSGNIAFNSYPVISASGEKALVENISVYTTWNLNGVKNENSDVHLHISNSDFYGCYGSIVGKGINSKITYSNIRITNALVGVLAEGGAQISGENILIENDEKIVYGTEAYSFLAKGVSSTDTSVAGFDYRITSIVPPAALDTARKIPISAVNSLKNWEYYYNNPASLANPNRLYFNYESLTNYSLTPGDIIYIGELEKESRLNPSLSSANLIKYDSVLETYYLELDTTFASANRWNSGLTYPNSFYNIDTNTLATSVKQKRNSVFSKTLTGSFKINRRTDSRKDYDRIFKVIVQGTEGTITENQALYFPTYDTLDTPLYINQVKELSTGLYELVLLRTSIQDIDENSATKIVEDKDPNNPYFSHPLSETYLALNSIPQFQTILSSVLANSTTANIVLTTPLSFKLRRQSIISSRDNYFNLQNDSYPGLFYSVVSRLGGLVNLSISTNTKSESVYIGSSEFRVNEGSDNTSEIVDITAETLSTRKELRLESGTELNIENGVKINPNNDGGRASATEWGFVKLAKLDSLIDECKGHQDDDLVQENITNFKDSYQIVSQNLLGQVLESKTAKSSDRIKLAGDTRKFISSSDLSTTSLLGVSRISTVAETVSSLGGNISLTDSSITVPVLNNPEYLNANALTQGLKSIVASSSQRSSYSTGTKLIVSSHASTTTEAGISKLAAESNALTIAGGTTTVTALTTLEQQNTTVINPYVLRNVLQSHFASSGDLSSGTGTGIVRTSDRATVALWGISKLMDKTELVSVVNSPNSASFITNTEANNSDGIVNKFALSAAFEGKKATTLQRATNGNSNLLINLSDIASTTEWGIGRVDDLAHVLSVAGGINSYDPVSLAGENSSSRLVNAFALKAALQSRRATLADRQTGSINNDSYITPADITSTTEYGVVKLDSLTHIISTAGGTNTYSTVSPANENSADKLVNIYGLKAALQSRRATVADRTPATINSDRIITPADYSTSTEYGVSKLSDIDDAVSIAGSDSSYSGYTVGNQNDSTELINAYALNAVLKSRRATLADRQSPATAAGTGLKWLTVGQTSEYDAVGYTQLAKIADTIDLIGGDSTSVSTYTTGLYNPGAADKYEVLSKYSFAAAIASYAAQADDLNPSTGLTLRRFITPNNTLTDSTVGLCRTLTVTELRNKITSYFGTNTVSVPTFDPLTYRQMVGIDQVADFIYGVRASDADLQLETASISSSANYIGLVTNKTRATTTKNGIGRLHDRFRPSFSVRPDDLLTVDILDPNTGYSTINVDFMQQHVPVGTLIDIAAPVGSLVPGYIACNGSSVAIASYPDLADRLKGCFGNPSVYTGSTFTLPNLPSSGAIAGQTTCLQFKMVRI